MDQNPRQSESTSPAKRENSSSKYTTDTSPMTDAKTSEPHRSLSPGPCSSVGRSILTTSRPPCDGNPQTKPFSNIPCVFYPTGLHSLRPYGEGGPQAERNLAMPPSIRRTKYGAPARKAKSLRGHQREPGEGGRGINPQKSLAINPRCSGRGVSHVPTQTQTRSVAS